MSRKQSHAGKVIITAGLGGGIVVSILVLRTADLSSIPAGFKNFSVIVLLERNGDEFKKKPGIAHLKKLK